MVYPLQKPSGQPVPPPNVLEKDEDITTIFTGVNIADGLFAMQELKKVKCSLKQGKSAGPDGSPPEVFKNCDFDDFLLSICNRSLTSGEIPSQWSVSTITPIPKSGTLTRADNYHGISLTCILSKLFSQNSELNQEGY